MRVLTVVVNYRTPDAALAAARSLVPGMSGLGKIVVVDNDSQDGSFEALTAAIAADSMSDTVEVVSSAVNGGFGFGNNIAFRRAAQTAKPPDYFYLLNPDALSEPDTVPSLVKFMDAHPTVGIAGCRIHGMDGAQHVSAFRFPTAIGELEAGLRLGIVTRRLRNWAVAAEMPSRTGPVDWVSGASLILRRSMLDEVGWFDERYFLYFEETDLCFRARRAGHVTWYVHEATVRHEGSLSTGMGDRKRRFPPYWFSSRQRFFKKNYGPGTLLTANALFALSYALFRVRRRIQGKPDLDPPHFLTDFLRYNLIPVPPPRLG